MEKKESKINYEKRSIPSGPGAQQITVEGQKSMKGGSDFYSEMPKTGLVKDGSKKK